MRNILIASLIICFNFILLAGIKAGCIYEKAIYGEDLPIGTMLHWSTSSESENMMFVIEKSADGLSFEKIGTIKGQGDSDDLMKYHFLDIMTQKETGYYRLRQVDFDGSEELTDILKVTRAYTNNFMIVRISSANIFDKLEVTLDSFKEGELTYRLTDWRGQDVLKEYLSLTYGLNELEIDFAELSPTIYHLEMEMDSEVEKITIRKAQDPEKKKDNMAKKKDGNKRN